MGAKGFYLPSSLARLHRAAFEQLYKDVGQANNLQAVKAILSKASQDECTALLNQKNSSDSVRHGSLSCCT